MDKIQHAQKLLSWYDRHARVLPWRVGPHAGQGKRAEPYHVWLSEIMLQQTVVKTVIPYFETFRALWPTVFDLAAADQEEVLQRWAGLGYYARARNLHACAQRVASDHDGRFPNTEKDLLALPGIGPYTASAIRAIAFDQPACVVDGNVERVIARLFALKKPLREIKPQIKAHAARLTPNQRPGDYAQAMMDLGATICTPKQPACASCPLRSHCQAQQDGCAAELPSRSPKKPKPVRYGTAFLLLREDGAVLLRQRPDKGLLAKMLEVPSVGWSEGRKTAWQELREDNEGAPIEAQWQKLPGLVTHTFTHFHLQLQVRLARIKADQPLSPAFDQKRCRWIARNELAHQALPGIMRKILTHGLGETIVASDEKTPR